VDGVSVSGFKYKLRLAVLSLIGHRAKGGRWGRSDFDVRLRRQGY
jgi:hypothetical protein